MSVYRSVFRHTRGLLPLSSAFSLTAAAYQQHTSITHYPILFSRKQRATASPHRLDGSRVYYTLTTEYFTHSYHEHRVNSAISAPQTVMNRVSKSDLSSDLTLSSLSLAELTCTPSDRHSALSYDLIHYIISLVLHSPAVSQPNSTSHHQKSDSEFRSDTPTPRNPTKRTESNFALLAKCSLVSHEFHIAATSLLYKDVVVSPRFNPVLNLREGLSVQASSNLVSAMQPHNATYVNSFEISGYISPRPGPRNPLPALIPLAIKAFINLRRVIFTPSTYHEQLFEEALPLLKTIPKLEVLMVGASCFGGDRPGIWGADHVVKIGITQKEDTVLGGENELGEIPRTADPVKYLGAPQRPVLTSIGLVSPGRAILERLPGWLEGLKRVGDTITELFLRSNCGSVTPGVLRAILPHIKDRLTHFTLGLSYSLTDEDVFNFVGEMECLKSLELRYYWQLKKPRRQPALRNLRTFIVSHPELQTEREFIELSKWIRRALKGSTGLEILKLCGDDDLVTPDRYTDADDVDQHSHNLPSCGSFDPLINHLVHKHSDKLRVLELGTGYITARAFKKICEGCQVLETIRARVGKGILNAFITHSAKLVHLQTFDVRLAHLPKLYLDGRSEVNVQWVLAGFLHGPESLWRIRIQGVAWEARWVVDEAGQTTRKVEEIDDEVLRPPWK